MRRRIFFIAVALVAVALIAIGIKAGDPARIHHISAQI